MQDPVQGVTRLLEAGLGGKELLAGGGLLALPAVDLGEAYHAHTASIARPLQVGAGQIKLFPANAHEGLGLEQIEIGSGGFLDDVRL